MSFSLKVLCNSGNICAFIQLVSKIWSGCICSKSLANLMTHLMSSWCCVNCITLNFNVNNVLAEGIDLYPQCLCIGDTEGGLQGSFRLHSISLLFSCHSYFLQAFIGTLFAPSLVSHLLVYTLLKYIYIKLWMCSVVSFQCLLPLTSPESLYTTCQCIRHV